MKKSGCQDSAVDLGCGFSFRPRLWVLEGGGKLYIWLVSWTRADSGSELILTLLVGTTSFARIHWSSILKKIYIKLRTWNPTPKFRFHKVLWLRLLLFKNRILLQLLSFRKKTQPMEVDLCCLRLLQLENLAQVRLHFTTLAFWAVLSLYFLVLRIYHLCG